MRNYLAELKHAGMTTRQITGGTGLSKSYINRVVAGTRRLKSSTRGYSAARNLNRRVAAYQLRARGIPSKQTNLLRRVALREKPIERSTVRVVRHKYMMKQKVWQYHIYGEFYNPKTKETRYEHGASTGYRSIKNVDRKEAEAAAIRDAQFKLGGSNWQLIKLLESNWIQYVLAGANS